MAPAHSLQEALERLALAKRLSYREVERLLELAAGDIEVAIAEAQLEASWDLAEKRVLAAYQSLGDPK